MPVPVRTFEAAPPCCVLCLLDLKRSRSELRVETEASFVMTLADTRGSEPLDAEVTVRSTRRASLSDKVLESRRQASLANPASRSVREPTGGLLSLTSPLPTAQSVGDFSKRGIRVLFARSGASPTTVSRHNLNPALPARPAPAALQTRDYDSSSEWDRDSDASGGPLTVSAFSSENPLCEARGNLKRTHQL